MKIAYAIAGACLFAGTALAQSGNLVTSVSVDDLERIATSEGHTVLGFGEAGEISVRAETEDGTIYFLTGTACEEGRCQGINLSSRYTADPDVVTFEKINEANIRRAAVSVWLIDGTSLGVSRYVILDGGMTEKNIKINLENFIAIVPTVIEMFYPQ